MRMGLPVLLTTIVACGGGGTELDDDGGQTQTEGTGGSGSSHGTSETDGLDTTDGVQTSATDDTTGVACVPTNDGTWEYSAQDSEDRFLIDTLFVLTADARQQIEGMGMTPDELLAFRVDEINETLDRSLIEGSRVRYLGVHTLVEADYARVGEYPGGPSQDIAQALSWLSSYRSAYGADKVAIIGSTAENMGNVALGGGDVSAYWVDFLPFEHEFGHCMGGSHCNEGGLGIHFGSPFNGYDAAGFPVEGPLVGGTRMCGNSAAFFSNPDVTLTVPELEAYAAEGLVPDQDYATLLGPGGTLTLGDASYANMAQVWRDAEQDAAERMGTILYPDGTDHAYADDDCVGFFEGTRYECLLFELCAGETFSAEDVVADVASVQVGRNVHVNLYSERGFGGASVFGGQLTRLAFSSPSLDAFAAHHGVDSLAGRLGSAIVFAPDDRESHFRHEGDFDYFHTGIAPRPAVVDGDDEVLVLLPDQSYWSGVAAVYRPEVEIPFAIDFDYSSGTVDPDHADGISVMFAKDASSYQTQAPPRETLGFIADGTGYGVRFTTWPTGSIAVVDGNYVDIGSPVGNPSTYTDGAFVPVHIEVREDSVRVTYDGAEQLDVAVPIDTTYSGVAIGAGTGAYTSEYRLRNFTITPL